VHKNHPLRVFVRPEDICFINSSGGPQPQTWLSIAGDEERLYIDPPNKDTIDLLCKSHNFIRWTNGTCINPSQVRAIKTIAPPLDAGSPFLEVTMKANPQPLLLFRGRNALSAEESGRRATPTDLVIMINDFDAKRSPLR